MACSAPVLGISVYLSEPEPDNLARLERAVERGVSAVFTSLHIPEDANVDAQPRLLRRLGGEARDRGLSLYADISPLTLRRLEPPGRDQTAQVLALAQWGLQGVRFDDGFDMGVVAAVSRGMHVQLNASTITDEGLAELNAAGAELGRVEALHNYYPRPDTGLGMVGYGRMNARLRAAGLRVGAFAPGDKVLRGPLREGLPTCEDHRGVDPVLAAVDLWHGPRPGEGADAVYVGDIDLAEETWQRWRWLADGVLPVRWRPTAADDVERAVAGMLSQRPATNRQDNSDRVIRLREFRPMIGEESMLAASGQILTSRTPGAGGPRPRGAVTVDNDDYGRYAGEVQITLVPLPADPRITVLGHVVEADLPMLDLVGGGDCLRLIES